LLVVAGASALQPLLALAGVNIEGGQSAVPLPTKEGIQNAADISSAAIRANYTGPLIAAVTFVRICSHPEKARSDFDQYV